MVAANVQTTCRVCGSHETSGWLYPREMMYGLREQFGYFRCAVCDCLQIDRVPADIGKHYPQDYYSFGQVQDPPVPRKTWLKRKFFYPSMTRHMLGWGSAFGALLLLPLVCPAGPRLAAFSRPPHSPKWRRAGCRLWFRSFPFGFARLRVHQPAGG